MFGHETWDLAKFPEVAQTLFFYSRGVEGEVIFALRAAVCLIFKTALGIALGHCQVSRSCTMLGALTLCPCTAYPLFITLIGPYYLYRIRSLLALNHTLHSQNLLVLANAFGKCVWLALAK